MSSFALFLLINEKLRDFKYGEHASKLSQNGSLWAVFALFGAIMQCFQHKESTLTANNCLLLCLLPN